MKANLFLLLVSFIWGTGFIGCQIVLDAGYTPLQLIAGRFLVGAVLLTALFFKRLKTMSKDALRAGCIIGVCLFCAFVFQVYGLKYSTPSVNAFVTATYVIMIPFLYWIVSRRRPGAVTLLAAVLTIAGVTLISWQPGDVQLGLGILLTLVCAFIYAVQVSVIDHYTKQFDPVVLAVIMVDFTAVAATVATCVMALFRKDFPAANPTGVSWLVYLGVLPTGLAFLGQNIGQKYTTAAKASIIFSTESAFAAILAAIVFKESLGAGALAGCALIFIAIVLSESSRAKKDCHPG